MPALLDHIDACGLPETSDVLAQSGHVPMERSLTSGD
jgi:hypothetical protein